MMMWTLTLAKDYVTYYRTDWSCFFPEICVTQQSKAFTERHKCNRVLMENDLLLFLLPIYLLQKTQETKIKLKRDSFVRQSHKYKATYIALQSAYKSHHNLSTFPLHTT